MGVPKTDGIQRYDTIFVNEEETRMKTANQVTYRPAGPASRSLASVGKMILYVVLVVAAILQLLPLVWLLLFSLKNNQEIFDLPPFALPPEPRWENYVKVWTQGNIGLYFVNSVWVTAASVILTILLASFVTYAITGCGGNSAALCSASLWRA